MLISYLPYIKKAHKLREYSKIIFLHIPKCAGISFISAFTLNNYFNAKTLSDDCELSLEENPLIVDNVFSEREIDYLQQNCLRHQQIIYTFMVEAGVN